MAPIFLPCGGLMAGKNSSSSRIVEIIIQGKNETAKAFAAVGDALGRTAAKVAAVGSALAGVVTTKLFAGALGEAQSLEKQLSIIQAVTGSSADTMQRLKERAEEMGATTKFTATEAASAMEVLARSGKNADQIFTVLPDVLTLAAAEGLELAEAARFVNDSLTLFGDGVEQATRRTDQLFKTASSADTDVRQLGLAMSYAGTLAKDAGLTFEQNAAALKFLADNAIRGERAGTGLRSILAQMLDPASKAREELKRLGITSADLPTVLDKLQAAGSRANDALLAFGTEAQPAIRALVRVGGAGLNEFAQSLDRVDGEAKQAAATAGNNLTGAVTLLDSAISAFKTRLADPVLKPLADELRSLATEIGEFTQSDKMTRLQKVVSDTFGAAAASVREFIRQTDPETAIKGVIEFAGQAAESLTSIANNVSTAFTVVGKVYDGAKIVIHGAATVISAAISVILSGVAALTSVLPGGGEAAAKAAAGFKQLSESFAAATEANLQATAQSFNSLVGATDKAADAMDNTARSADAANLAVSDVGNAAEQAAADLSAFGGAGEDVFNRTAQGAKQAAESLQIVKTETDDLKRAFEGVAFDGTAESAKALADSLQKSREEAEGQAQASDKAAQSTDNLADSAKSASTELRQSADASRALGEVWATLINSTRAELRELSDAAAAVFDALLPDIASSPIVLMNRDIRALAETAGSAKTEADGLAQALRSASGEVETLAERSQFADPINRAFFNVRLAAARVREEFFKQRVELQGVVESLGRAEQIGGQSLQQVANRAERTAGSFTLLADTDLEPLRQQIARVRQETARLQQEANSTLASLQERIAQLRGDEQQLLALRHGREQLEIERQLQEAKRLGDKQAIEALETSLSLLEQINREERKRLEQETDRQRKEDDRKRRTGGDGTDGGNGGASGLGSNASNSPGRVTVDLNLGGRSVELQGSEEQVRQLIAALQQYKRTANR